MQFDIRIAREQTQRLSLSAEMKQSLEILAMSMEDLKALLENAAAENPMLEVVVQEDEEDAWCDSLPIEVGNTRQDEEDDSDMPAEHKAGDGGALYDAMHYDHGESFNAMLAEQLAGKELAPQCLELCRYLIACLNRQGYLESGIEDIAFATGQPLTAVAKALTVIQSLQPAGVGARSLQECLLLQLAENGFFNFHTVQLVKNGLQLVAANDIKGIIHLLGVDRKTALQYCEAVRGLNPIPSQGYYTGEDTCYIVPDAVLKEDGNGFSICMNSSAIPRLMLSREYRALLKTELDSGVTEYLSCRLKEARTLLKATEGRNRTLLKVMRCIAETQCTYFQDGYSLKSMTLKDIAERTGLHISTVSRAVKDKYILCKAGTVSLKSLFATGMENGDGDKISSAVICRQIGRLIQDEDAATPLSDEDLRIKLEETGVAISRRTVAKYRMAMGVASSSVRARR